uniref:DDHD domain-containing protein n=1 Tax=Panagrolaimus davidi TaxID=227884 RepID=A0A914QZF8_9BILA
MWLLLRSEWVYEVQRSPPVLYFMNIEGDSKMILDELANILNTQYALFKSRNPNFNGNISVLAHSLGSAITFDLTNSQKYDKLNFKIENIFLTGSPLGKFLASNGTKAEKLYQNEWIKDGKLFNILHSDDPVAHRMEVMFNVNYSYAPPSNLFFHKDFRASYEKSIEITEIENHEVASFHQYIIDDRSMAVLHDSFLTVDYLAHGFEFDAQHFNVCDINEMFKDDLEFLRKIFHNRKIRNITQIIHPIPSEMRIKHRLD